MTFNTSSIHAAAERLRGLVIRTPLLESPQLNEIAGARVLVKAESLQLTGSFKIRGALNRVFLLSEDDRARGLVAYSAGNHGQGVAAAAKLAAVPATIVMPRTAPRVKIENCRWWGAEVVLFDPATEDRVVVSEALVRERGLILVPPFDDHDVMSGQGTVGLEIVEDLAAAGINPDAIVVNASGGGLAAGVIEAVLTDHPSVQAFITEPAGRDKLAQSLASGTPVTLTDAPSTIMDALAGPTAGTLPVEALSRHTVTGLTVNDQQALDAIATAFATLRLVLEPGGAASLATVLAGRERFSGKTVVIVASGGNVDPSTYIRALSESQ